MKVKLNSFILIGLSVILLSACRYECWNALGSGEYKEIIDAIANGRTDAAKIFLEFSIDKQITIFLYARNCHDDPRIRSFFLLDGENKIPYIIERIEKEEKIWDKAVLVGILIPINTQCRCISKDSDVIKTLEIEGEELDKNNAFNETYKQMYHESVNVLKNQLDKYE